MDRKNILTPIEPSLDLLFQIANNYLAKIKAVTQGFMISTLGEESNWGIQYLNDDDSKVDDGLTKSLWGSAFEHHVCFLSKESIQAVKKLPNEYKLKSYESLMLEADAIMPSAGAAIILAFSSIEAAIDRALNSLHSIGIKT